MPFPFGKSHKSPADIVKNLKDSMTVLEKHDISDKKAEKVGEWIVEFIASGVSIGRVELYSCVLFVIIQATEEVSKSLVAMKEILYGTNEKEPQTEAVAQLAQELYNSGLLSTLIADLQLIDFEVDVFQRCEVEKCELNNVEWTLAQILLLINLIIYILSYRQGKKDVAQIFNNILRRQIGTRTPTVEYLCTQQNILFMLLKG